LKAISIEVITRRYYRQRISPMVIMPFCAPSGYCSAPTNA
jgi:hypothetical protein